MEDLQSMKRLWVHEILRVYYDRLTDDSDRSWLIDALHKVCDDKLEEDLDLLFRRIATPGKKFVRKIKCKKKSYSRIMFVFTDR